MGLQYFRPNFEEIRLLRILPGVGKSQIRCPLHHVPLRTHLKHEALSYIWDDPSPTLPITVDGSSYQVTINLESALRNLRQPLTTWMISADALCINQDDLQAKSVEVSYVDKMYQNIIWLSE